MRRAAPLAVAVFAFGVAFGLLARAAGFSVVVTLVFSATTFAGSAQFAAVSVLSSGGSLVAAVVAALLLNARYAPIGASVAPWLTGPWWRRLLIGQITVDESWVISNEGGGRFDPRKLVGAGVRSTRPGSSARRSAWPAAASWASPRTSVSTPPSRPCSWPCSWARCTTAGRLTAALLGGAIALVLVPLTPAGVPIIAASLGCLIGLRPPARPATPEDDPAAEDGLP